MKFVSDIRLLLTGLWLGASVFFIGVAQAAFSVAGDYVLSVAAQQQRERAQTFVRVHVEP